MLCAVRDGWEGGWKNSGEWRRGGEEVRNGETLLQRWAGKSTPKRQMTFDVPLHGQWQLVAARHCLHHDVLLFDAGLHECLLCAFNQRVDDLGIPPRVHDADS